MNLRGLDLNLLVVLDALLAEQHVTRAGQRLGLSQPATSNALERLRRLFDDPLLERVPGGLRATPRAQALRSPLTDLLAGVSSLVSSGSADLRTLKQSLRLSVVDYGLALFVPPLMASLAERAPGIDLVCVPWSGAEEAHAALEAGTLDLAISVSAPASLRFRPIFTESYVVAMREKHPARRLTLARWLEYPHVVVSGRGSATGALDAVLAERGQRRRVGVVVPSFLAIPPLLLQSDLLALVPETLSRLASQGLVHVAPPLPVPGFEVTLVWHPRRDADPAVRFVRDELARLAAPELRARAGGSRRRVR
jgi:DNA-binding transcriptional LysR family regulator